MKRCAIAVHLQDIKCHQQALEMVQHQTRHTILQPGFQQLPTMPGLIIRDNTGKQLVIKNAKHFKKHKQLSCTRKFSEKMTLWKDVNITCKQTITCYMSNNWKHIIGNTEPNSQESNSSPCFVATPSK